MKKAGFDGVLSYETEGNQTEEEAKRMIAESRTLHDECPEAAWVTQAKMRIASIPRF